MEFAQIIEAGLEDLSHYLESRVPDSSLEIFYAHCLVAYHRGDIERLESLARDHFSHFSNHPEAEYLHQALTLRVALRRGKVSEVLVTQSQEYAAHDTRWSGELLMLVGAGEAQLGQHESARTAFAAAAIALEDIGARKKALKSRMNVIVADSHIDDKQNLIASYFDLYNRSQKEDWRDDATASICLLNISREYQVLGTVHAALKYASEALHLAETNFGSLHYFLCLAHRAHLLCDLERFSEARVDYECAMAAPFPEVKAALDVLKPLLEKQFPELALETNRGSAENALPNWQERSREDPSTLLSTLENQLIEFLSQGPKEKTEILEHLYGTRLDFEVKLNRFKSLLGNLRRKSPDILVNEGGAYRLNQTIHSPKRKKR